MPKQTSFAVLYRKLVDCHFSPDPQQLDDEMAVILRQLSSGNSKQKRNLLWPQQESCDIINQNEKKGTSK